MRLRDLSNVDFPQPDGPIKAVMLFSSISRLTFCNAWKSLYHKFRLCIDILFMINHLCLWLVSARRISTAVYA